LSFAYEGFNVGFLIECRKEEGQGRDFSHYASPLQRVFP
jgi:hypothetical protein